jgi:thiamine-phosphate pyrophosphorylase
MMRGLSAALRIVDANLNRALEALRVVEDILRFALERGDLVEEVRLLRRELGKTLSPLQRELLAARDVLGDVGIEKKRAFRHRNMREVFIANSSRVKEALRVLEEYMRLIDAKSSQNIAKLRYRFYEIERSASCALFPQGRLTDALLYVIVSSEAPKGAVQTAHLAARGGADVIQLREKNLPDSEVIKTARKIRKNCSASRTLFIVNDRPDIAACVNADGVHLGQNDMPLRDARRVMGSDAIIGVSTHSVGQAREAQREGADYLGVGAVFPTQTKEKPLLCGLKLLQSLKEMKIPWFAIGGIDEKNLPQVLSAGARRVAISSYICNSSDPEEAARRMKNVLLRSARRKV